ncbi:helix-turn-helix domain-containing protein [Chryseobacterium sp. JM1]|uniref:helix-turn-helix domain-containing protein n=1 Tax=Chryseobacterium sp. JM1 TaxID=1233950 RepID=UPI0009DFA44A|nr:helix-turn-helix domain-containing protein [Chryseobacterium sp. JM1]
MMRFKYCMLLILVYSLFFSQNKGPDSLQKYSYQELQQKFYNYNNSNQTDHAQRISTYFLHKAHLEKDDEQKAEGYVMMHFNENLPNALKYLDSLQVITRKSTKPFYPARVYLLRGNLYSKFYNVKAALGNYVLTLEHAREKGNKRQIAFAEINIAYLNNYVGRYRDAANTLKHYLYKTDYLDQKDYDNMHVNLADTYIDLNKMDSANILIKEGLNLTSEAGRTYQYHGYLVESGYYHLKLKKYQEAVDDLLQCKDYFFTTHDVRNQSYTLYYLVSSYIGLGNKEKAVENFKLLDAHIKEKNYIFPELRMIYPYVINYYKEKKDRENQLYYIERFIEIDKVLDSQFRYISRELPRRYEKPKLVKEKEIITHELENKKIIFYVSSISLLSVLLVFIYLYYQSKKAEKQHRQIAQDLIQKVQENNKNEPAPAPQPENIMVELPSEDPKERNANTISEDVVQHILKELTAFEAKDQFLNKGITLGSLAKRVKTNSKYLSETINTYKGKNFAAYLNDLRIDYAIRRLANDRKFRSYKIQFIADELGYNNEQAFTLAFKKRTGTPLSIYLKEIEKSEN